MLTPRSVLETALYCEDLATIAAWYERLLVPTVLLRTDRLVALDVGGHGSVLLLFQQGQSTRPLVTPNGTIPSHDGAPSGHLAFAIEQDDLAAWERQLAAQGIEIESRVTWERGGTSLYFRDPEGRSVELATRGTWITY